MWRCDKCGEKNTNDQVSCWKCWIHKDAKITRPGSAISRVGDKHQIEIDKKPVDASRVLMAVGIVIAIIGVGLIMISPNFIFHDQVPGPFLGTTIMYDRTTDLTGKVKGLGIFLLIVGGIISAVGFSKSGSTQPTPTRSEPTAPMKTCPECAESVKDAAKICRFCGHKFS